MFNWEELNETSIRRQTRSIDKKKIESIEKYFFRGLSLKTQTKLLVSAIVNKYLVSIDIF